MTLQELKHHIHKWCNYYNNQNIPLKHVHVVVTLNHPHRYELVEIDDNNIEHATYEAQHEDEELFGKGTYKNQYICISLHQFDVHDEDDINEEESNKE